MDDYPGAREYTRAEYERLKKEREGHQLQSWTLKGEIKHGWQYWPGIILVFGVPLFLIIKGVLS
jgi:hypothetical protein